jgi:predicted GNAT superfamily acetyltransferase
VASDHWPSHQAIVTSSVYTIRPLKTLGDCQRVVDLEKRVWGYSDGDDVVPAAILIVSAKRGGILLGAFDGSAEMVGFVYSLAAMKDGRPTQWSHMLGVLPAARDAGLGGELKKEQRRRALDMGITLIEWTFDPMQALNAHLNFAKLGVVVEEYLENLYGESSSPLHQGTPTDRFIAQWRLDAPHVVRRLQSPTLVMLRDEGSFTAPLALSVVDDGRRLVPRLTETLDARRVAIEIPEGFGNIMAADRALALEWRLATRDAFTAYLRRGYRVVDFFFDKERGRGRYLVVKGEGSAI